LISALQDGLQQAADQASQQPERFSQIISQAVDQAAGAAQEVAQIPEQLWNKIKESADNPDWLGLMLFLAVQLRDAVGDPPLKIGAYDPGDGWSKALILIYTQSVPSPLNEAEFRLSIALGSEGTKGIIIEAKNAPHFEIMANPLTFGARATGDGKWRFPFSGGSSGPEVVGATVGLDVALAQPILPGGGDLSFAIGIPKVSGSAEVGTDAALSWKVDVSFGTEAAPGLHAKLDLSSFLGDLASVVQLQVIDERYSPTLHLSSSACRLTASCGCDSSRARSRCLPWRLAASTRGTRCRRVPGSSCRRSPRRTGVPAGASYTRRQLACSTTGASAHGLSAACSVWRHPPSAVCRSTP
jgi:hypothetical protein